MTLRGTRPEFLARIGTSTEASKKYIERQYANQPGPESGERLAGKRLFSRKKLELQDIFHGEPAHQERESEPEPAAKSEPKTEPVWAVPPRIPSIPIHPPVLAPPGLPERPGLSRVETTSGNIARDLDEFDRLAHDISRKTAQIESDCLDCKSFAQLGGILSDEAVQQLNAIHGAKEEKIWFYEVIEFVRACIGLRPPASESNVRERL
jgi:hypothetical protein